MVVLYGLQTKSQQVQSKSDTSFVLKIFHQKEGLKYTYKVALQQIGSSNKYSGKILLYDNSVTNNEEKPTYIFYFDVLQMGNELKVNFTNSKNEPFLGDKTSIEKQKSWYMFNIDGKENLLIPVNSFNYELNRWDKYFTSIMLEKKTINKPK